MKKIWLLLISACLFAGEAPIAEEELEEENPEEPVPWFTGPLIAPAGTAVPWGTFEIDSYVYFVTETGEYNEDWGVDDIPNFYSFNPQFLCYFGLTPWMDINIVPQFSVNWTEGQRSVGFNDFLAGFDFQLYSDEEEGWFPGIKVSAKELFPTGKYQRLNPKKLFTDEMGKGSFTTFFGLFFYKIYPLWDIHFLSFTLSGEYGISSRTHVHGLNTYGGGFGTNGHVKPGNSFEGICSFEFNLTQNWSFALDTVWFHSDLSSFSGDPGTDEEGNPAFVGNPSSESLSFAPAIEYGFSETLGIIAGCWFSAMGRNSTQFRNAVMNLYYEY